MRDDKKIKPKCWECKHFEPFSGRDFKVCPISECPIWKIKYEEDSSL